MSKPCSAPVTIHAAKTHLSQLIARVEAGEEIVIARGDTPVAKLVPIAPVPANGPRPLGFLAHLGPIPPDAFDPDPDDWAGDDKPL
jgi:prevent-host-death family protein